MSAFFRYHDNIKKNLWCNHLEANWLLSYVHIYSATSLHNIHLLDVPQQNN